MGTVILISLICVFFLVVLLLVISFLTYRVNTEIVLEFLQDQNHLRIEEMLELEGEKQELEKRVDSLEQEPLL